MATIRNRCRRHAALQKDHRNAAPYSACGRAPRGTRDAVDVGRVAARCGRLDRVEDQSPRRPIAPNSASGFGCLRQTRLSSWCPPPPMATRNSPLPVAKLEFGTATLSSSRRRHGVPGLSDAPVTVLVVAGPQRARRTLSLRQHADSTNRPATQPMVQRADLLPPNRPSLSLRGGTAHAEGVAVVCPKHLGQLSKEKER